MEIRRYPSDLLLSNMYLIVEDDAALVIDPSRDTAPGKGLTIDRIILTHEHYDHISGVNAWKAATGAKMLCSYACGENVKNPRKNLARIFDAFCQLQTWIQLDHLPDADSDYTCTADETFSDCAKFKWRGHLLSLMEIPGHSRGSIGILLDEEFFFSGDSLMANSDVELRFPGGSKKLWEAVGAPRIGKLADGIRVFPGHFGDFIYHNEKGGCL